MSKSKEVTALIITGIIIGIIAVGLVLAGNPKNMGFCLACFIRDSAGALKLHTAAPVQYLRPEIIGLVLGSFFISLATKEFKVRGGSSPVLRFFLGFMVMIGALVFLGCPLRMVLRMAGGDLNAWVGFIGFVLGVFTGTIFLKQGFSLNRNHPLSQAEGLAFPIVQVLLLVVLVAVPGVLAFTPAGEGPAGAHANLWLSLGLALIVGAAAQKTRLCQAGGIRDILMFKDTTLFWGGFFIFAAALVMNLVTKQFNFGFEGQPIAHTEWLWNIIGLYIVGLGSTLLGGCPMRQLVLSGTGNTDSAIAVLGMLVGAAFAHNFGLASSGKGTTPAGRTAAIGIIVIMIIIGVCNSRKSNTRA